MARDAEALRESLVQDVMRADFETVPPDEPCSKVLSQFADHAGGVLVLVNGKGAWEGLVTERNILRSGVNPHNTPVSSVVQSSTKLALDDSLVDAAARLLDQNTRVLPVIHVEHSKEKVSGVLVLEDILADAAKTTLGDAGVTRFMTRDVTVVDAEDSVAKALSLMRKGGFSRLPVIDDGKLAGIVTIHDIIRSVVAPLDREGHPATFSGETKRPLSIPVRGVMTNPVVTMSRDGTYKEAVGLLRKHGIGSVVVTKDGGYPQGIVSRRDLLEPVALLASEVATIVVHFSSKDTSRDGYETSGAAEDVKKFLSRYQSQIEPGVLTIHAKKHKDRHHRTDLWHVRLNLTGDLGKFHAVGEGWGMQHATRMAVEHLEREVRRAKEERLDHPSREYIEELLY